MSHTNHPSFQLGIELLLQGNEQEAQIAWLDAISSVEESEAEFFLELAKNLVTEGDKQKNLGNWSMAWVLYRYACENLPSLENWLQALQASLQAAVNSSDSDLEPDGEALDQCLEILTAQKFAIAPELINLLLASLEILRSQYPQSLENLDVDT
jgi:tetratricopeptide (TPR) repeat protein